MSQQDETIDALILSAATTEWQKVAVIISKVFDAPALTNKDGLGQMIAERVYVLVDNGRLAVQGNMRRWRDGAVKLVKGK